MEHCNCNDTHNNESRHSKHCACGNGKHSHGHRHGHEGARRFVAPCLSFVMLIAGIILDHFGIMGFTPDSIIRPIWYIAAFLPTGLPVIREAIEGIASRDYFNEFTLMTIACIGAFCIREYPEAVGVMLFYSIGETLQDMAVDRATRNISRLLDVRGEHATVIRNGEPVRVKPEEVMPGEVIEVYPGERVPLDGTLESEEAAFDTSALTGESVPRDISRGEEVLAGMISSGKRVRINVTRRYADSALSRILDLVNNAQEKKAPAELFMRRFARVYTPVVIVLALLVIAVPAIVATVNPSFHYTFSEWLYRALVFLVISCPCALVISVPLGYFAGIGAASRKGILFKGGNYLEAITRVNTVAFDKTGTLTTGRFSVIDVKSVLPDRREMLSLLAAAESGSSHPLAKAVVEYVTSLGIAIPVPDKMKEIAGNGTHATVSGTEVMAGSLRMLRSADISYPEELTGNGATIIACAVDGKYAGYVTLADTIKEDAPMTVEHLHKLGIDDVVMLSGDKKETVDDYARRLGIKEAHGELLPEDKAEYVGHISSTPGKSIAFVGDGMNDAPVLAISNIGVAMGGLGSDAAIESADVVIQTDQPSRLITAIKIGRTTHSIVMENIIGAIAIKAVILILGAAGYASLWAAVFADVGVALLAVLNSMRILWKRY